MAFTLYSSEGREVAEGTLPGGKDGAGKVLTFWADGYPANIDSLYIKVYAIDPGNNGDFWGDKAPLMLPVTESLWKGGTFELTLNADRDDEGDEEFVLLGYEHPGGDFLGDEPVITGVFKVIDDDFRGTDGHDRINGTGYADYIEGLGSADTVLAAGGNDSIYGGGGDDSLTGARGDDLISGGSGNDTMIGGEGNDRYYLDGSDTIVETATGGADWVYTGQAVDMGEYIEHLQLTGSAALKVTANKFDNTMRGNDGDNHLRAEGGNDTLNGGLGRDRLVGGTGDDLYQIDGGDILVELAGGGRDTVDSQVTATLGANFEVLRLRGGADSNATGNDEANELAGNSGRNALSGLGGDDRLTGGTGRDTLVGGTGKDWLDGGSDNERDLFVFRSTGEAGRGRLRDEIAGFRHGTDDIDLHTIDADTGARGHQKLAFGGSRAVDHGIWIDDTGRDLVVRGDVTGDAVADFEITVLRIDSIDKGDFWL